MVELFCSPFVLGDSLAVWILDAQSRADANVLDLTAVEQTLIFPLLEQPELDAGGTGVDDCDALRHHYWTAAFALCLRAATSNCATEQDARRAIFASARLVRMIGTFAPRTIPAASASARNERLFASILPASRSGTRRTLARPATGDLI